MKYYQIYSFVLLAMLFVACSTDDDKITDSDPIAFISQSASFTGSSEAGQWESGDQIGAFMTVLGSTTPLGNSSNITYAAETTGATATFSSTTPLKYPDDGTMVSFVAYYPYSSEVSNLVYPISLSNQADGTRKHDLMTAQSQRQSKYTSANVPMTFKHQLSKVVFKFVDKNGNALSPTVLTIEGMNTTADFNIGTSMVQNASGTTTITPFKSASGDHEAIVMPVTLNANTHMINYTIDGKSIEWSLTDVLGGLSALQAGNKYTFTLNHDDLAIPATVEIESGSITPWDNQSYEDGGTAHLIINYTTFPANEATDVFKDTYLKIDFESAPAVGTAGRIRVYKASDNTLVDEINMADEQPRFASNGKLNSKMDILGKVGNNGGRHRVVNYNPVTIEANTAIIKLHYDNLDYNTQYYVVVDKGVIDHTDFNGITGPTKWTFTTKSEPTVPTDNDHTVTVGGDNSNADFRSIQAAIDFLASKVSNADQKTVFVQNGTYEELLFMRGVNNLTIKGESREGVIIRYANSDGFNGGTGGSGVVSNRTPGSTIGAGGGRAVLLLERSDKIRLENLTMENTHVKNNSGDQAEVIYANNDTNQALSIINCNILSFQDTLNLKGYVWFYNSLIAGDVDFIWGSPIAALFENCELRSRGDGYIIQSRSSEDNKGFVFLNCELTTTGDATQMFLSRTTGNASYFDNITFGNCKMADIYGTYGWGYSSGGSGTAPNPAVGTLANGYKMYNNTNLSGAPITINNESLAYKLTETEFNEEFSSAEKVLSKYADVSWFK